MQPTRIFLGACALAAAGAVAAAPPPEFAVTPAQMQALGVTLQKLDQPAQLRGIAYPARVIVPPGREQVVSAPVDGVVDQLLVSGQEAVRAGQPLLRLASPDYGEMQLKLMEAAAKARLSQKTAARERQLFAEGIIPERRVQEAETASAGDAGRVRQAQAEMRLAGADAATIQRIAGGGSPDDGLLVRARNAGVVVALEAKPGQRVKEADPLARLIDARELWLEIAMPPRADVPPAGEITVVGRAAVAVPQSQGALVNESQTTVLRARVVRGAAQLRPGEVVQAQVPHAVAQGWVLPLGAVTRNEDQAYVFVRSPQGFVATPVTVLSTAGTSVQVAGNLKAGQELATGSVVALKSAWLGKGGGN